MALKKYIETKVSELTEITDTTGFYIFGSKTVGGTWTSVRFAFDKITSLFGVTQDKGGSLTLAPSQKVWTDDLLKKFNTPNALLKTIASSYISQAGVITGGNNVYNVNVYALTVGQTVSIRGTARGATSAYATYSDEACTQLIQNYSISSTVISREINDILTPDANIYLATCLHNQIEINPLNVYSETLVTDTSFNSFKPLLNTIASTYINSNGVLTGGNTSYKVEVYKLLAGDEVLIKGTAKGATSAYATYSDESCTQLIQRYSPSDTVINREINDIIVADTDCYLAACLNLTITVNTLSILQRDSLFDIAGHVDALKMYVDKPLNGNEISPIITRYNAYIDATGTLINNFSADSFFTRIYYLQKGQKVKIEGVASSLCAYATYKDMACTWKIAQYHLNNALVPISEYFIADTDCYLATTITKFIDPKKWLKVYNDAISTEVLDIDTWGDSLTAAGTYQNRLLALLGSNYRVNNYGIGGERADEIAGRMGAIPFVVNPFTISESKDEQTLIDLTFMDKSAGKMGVLRQGDRGFNPVFINGIVGNIIHVGGTSIDDDHTYYFKRSYDGDAVTISRPEIVNSFGSYYRRGNITVIWAGTNDHPDDMEQFNALLQRISTMIKSRKTDKYIVIGLTVKAWMPMLEDFNNNFQREFGDKFLNISNYMLNYGLADAGITPTATDTANIAAGEIPLSLRVDDVHFNSAGYNIVGEQVYKRGAHLAYW